MSKKMPNTKNAHLSRTPRPMVWSKIIMIIIINVQRGAFFSHGIHLQLTYTRFRPHVLHHQPSQSNKNNNENGVGEKNLYNENTHHKNYINKLCFRKTGLLSCQYTGSSLSRTHINTHAFLYFS